MIPVTHDDQEAFANSAYPLSAQIFSRKSKLCGN
jgi:hypothetical protein